MNDDSPYLTKQEFNRLVSNVEKDMDKYGYFDGDSDTYYIDEINIED